MKLTLLHITQDVIKLNNLTILHITFKYSRNKIFKLTKLHITSDIVFDQIFFSTLQDYTLQTVSFSSDFSFLTLQYYTFLLKILEKAFFNITKLHITLNY